MRVILRLSIDNEQNSHLRNMLANRLQAAGFQRNGNTATWEILHIAKADLATFLNDFWATASNHAGPGRLDHFWMYSDRTALDDIAGIPEPFDEDAV